MDKDTLKHFLIGAVITLLMIGGGFAIGLFAQDLFRPKVVETAAPAVKQDDGSTVIERGQTDPKAKSKNAIPKGGKAERVDHLTITPTEKTCPPVDVDLTLVRMDDGTRRVVASSPQGEVKGIDIPVETPAIEEPKHWAAGLSYDPIKQTPGAWIERDVWRIRLGLEANQTRQQIGGPLSGEVRVRVGVTF